MAKSILKHSILVFYYEPLDQRPLPQIFHSNDVLYYAKCNRQMPMAQEIHLTLDDTKKLRMVLRVCYKKHDTPNNHSKDGKAHK